MRILVDKKVQHLPGLSEHSTVGDLLKWARAQLAPGRVLVQIKLDDQLLDATALSQVRRDAIGTSTLSLITGDQKELSLTMLGKLAALINWLAPQHKEVASLLEQGNTQKGLDRLSGILSAWQQIQGAYANLATMLNISLKDLPVRELSGETILSEFCRQLEEIQGALQGKDFVLLADILQYEMEGAVANWTSLLESTLGIVEPVTV